jgi:hypothetical protein
MAYQLSRVKRTEKRKEEINIKENKVREKKKKIKDKTRTHLFQIRYHHA